MCGIAPYIFFLLLGKNYCICPDGNIVHVT